MMSGGGWERLGSEGPGEYDISLSLPHSSTTGCSERVSYSVARLYEAAVINCLYQPGRAEGGRAVAYLYVNQLYRTRLDVVLAGHVTSVARIGSRYEFWLTLTLHANHAVLLEGISSSIITWYRARYWTILIVPDTTEYRPIPDAGIVLSLLAMFTKTTMAACIHDWNGHTNNRHASYWQLC